MKKKMALLATALVGASMGLVACKTNIGWLDKKICEHDEYKLVEVVEVTCAEEGEKIMECVKCGKTASEKIEKLAHTDEDGDGTCDVCEHKEYELVEPSAGETMIGNTYRIYDGGSIYFKSNNGYDFYCSFFDDKVGMYMFEENDISPFEFIYGEDYVQFTVKPCDYTFDDGLTDSITPSTKLKTFSGTVYRVVAVE